MRSDSGMVKSGTLNPLIFVVRNSHIHADVGAVFKIEDYAGVFDCLPCGFQQQPMLRVDVRSFPWRDAKKLRVELVDVVQESSPLGDRFSGESRLGIVEMFYVPSVR